MNVNKKVVNDSRTAQVKREWIRPQVQQLEAGAAEGSFAGRADGVGQQQS